jgi:vacuolar-type H+-ATPase subunit H
MIKDKLADIINIEKEAADITEKARTDSADRIKEASHEASKKISQVQNRRKEITELKIKEAEAQAENEAKSLLKESETKSQQTAQDSSKNFDIAVNKVFERVMRYGDQ